MAPRKNNRPTRHGWRDLAVVAGCIAVVAGAGYWVRSAMLPRADAQSVTPAVSAPTPAAATPAAPSDYSTRVVAYLFKSEPITREQLGDYLIDRYGEKIELLVNRRIIDDACKKYGIEVTAAEIDAALNQELQGFAINKKTFVETILARYHKSLFEFKEDILRPKLQMSKLCRRKVTVSEEQIRKAFESAHGEKIECQIILWPKGERGTKDALEAYASIRDNADAFDKKAKAQTAKPELAATAGKVAPFGRYVMGDDHFDRIVFRLQPNEVSEVFNTVDGPVVVKCLRRLPADSSIRLETVREKIAKEIADKQVLQELRTAFQTLKTEAKPQIYLKKKKKAEDPDGLPANANVPHSRQVLAVYNGQTPITREEFGEFLIARYGVEQLEFLVNRRIIDKECQARRISVTAQEIEADLAGDLKKMGGVTEATFVKEYLTPQNRNVYQWREDVIRTRLLLTKLCQDGVKVTEQELKMAYEANFGEKLECRMILWPKEQTKYALAEYAQIRDNPQAFDEKAKHQASSSLAAQGGKLPPIGRTALGNEQLEREAFRLQVGDVTTLVGTPEGNVVLKLDKRIPANKSITLESVRKQLTNEVFERKVQVEMQTACQKLRLKAEPNLLLANPDKPIELTESTRKLLQKPGEEIKNDKH
jgi:parvulin-like peptidyl-prolyl isomerase